MAEKKEGEEKERVSENRDSGDWGNPGRWGTFGNRPNFYREEIVRDEPEPTEDPHEKPPVGQE
jgi:hypothetical protein